MGYGDIGASARRSTARQTGSHGLGGNETHQLLRGAGLHALRAQLMTGCYAKRVSLPDVIFPAASA